MTSVAADTRGWVLPVAESSIAVAGDVSVAHNVYTERSGAARCVPAAAGAWGLHALLAALADGGTPNFSLVPMQPPAPFASAAAPSSSSPPPVASPADVSVSYFAWKPDDAQRWRLSQLAGTSQPVDAVTPVPAAPPAANVLAIEDAAGSFRHRAGGWAKKLASADVAARWIVLRAAAPLAQGAAWHHLVADGSAARPWLVVLTTLDELRLHHARVSDGLSWEATAIELAAELRANPALAGLRRAAQVLVSIGCEGCVRMRRRADGGLVFTLTFDPHFMERDWAGARKLPCDAHGETACLAASVAAQLAAIRPRYPVDQGLHDAFDAAVDAALNLATAAGLEAMRTLRSEGHGAVGAGSPGFPYAAVATAMRKAAAKDASRPSFVVVDVPLDQRLDEERTQTHWRILEGLRPRAHVSPQPLHGIAKRVALFGPVCARVDAPLARFGKLLTADRDEIEALRNVRRLVNAYKGLKEASKPLCLAVFGPPGAGKSFGIKQIAAELFGDKPPFLEFNLSQFRGPDDLIGAFHQVRDKVLEGRIPTVFWDEFDSKEYQWLQYFLAPMQDGKFQQEQLTHNIGKCVFVFAGATSYDAQNFGPRKSDVKAWNDFALRKGPDFVSRINGSLNVLGPNRRQRMREDGAGWADDPHDICFPVRRGLLLRSMLGMRDDEPMQIDRGLLAALIETPRYTFGSRSFENVVAPLKGIGPIRRSALPADAVLQMHLGGGDGLLKFEEIMTRSQDFERLAEQLAPAIHRHYVQLADEKGWDVKYRCDFKELPVEMQAVNVAAARRIPAILELAGLFLARRTGPGDGTPKEVRDTIERLIDVLAKEEHDQWMENLKLNGWRHGKPRDDAQRIHPCLVKYDELDEEDREKDRNAVRQFPAIADRAGFKIIAERPKGE